RAGLGARAGVAEARAGGFTANAVDAEIAGAIGGDAAKATVAAVRAAVAPRVAHPTVAGSVHARHATRARVGRTIARRARPGAATGSDTTVGSATARAGGSPLPARSSGVLLARTTRTGGSDGKGGAA